jgi:transcriptional regulator with XRE-family HTH domain
MALAARDCVTSCRPSSAAMFDLNTFLESIREIYSHSEYFATGFFRLSNIFRVLLDLLAPSAYIRGMTTTPHTARSTAAVNNEVGAEVRAWMGRLGFRQKHLAEVLDVSQTAISQRLNGKVTFGIDELQIISTWFGITLGDLLGSGVLNAKNPRPHVEDGESGAELLLLDLNQQPFD